MFYTYCHVSTQTNQIFYYGKGSEERAYCKQNRNKRWHEMANKGYEIVMLAPWKTNQEALDHERFLIWCARNIGLDIVNITGGGQGVLGAKHWVGRKHKPESIAKMKLVQKGSKRRKSAKFSVSKKSFKNPFWKGYWVTPDGKFATLKEAAEHYKVNGKTISDRCKGYTEKLVNSIKKYPPKDGWSFEPKII